MAFFTGGAKDVMRAMTLMKRRQQEHERIEEKKRKIEEENRMKAIDDKFKTHCDTVEDNLLKTDTIGLVTLEDMKKKQESVAKAIELKHLLDRDQARKAAAERKLREENNKKIQIARLSFGNQWLEEDARTPTVSTQKAKRRLGKNPDVDSSFLPDKDREDEEAKMREQLKSEWLKRQEKVKSEDVEILFSFWDGSGHPRSVIVKKGDSIQQFLYKALDQLRNETCFAELKSASVDQMMYVKDDVILAHHHTFYELMANRSRGKHGYLLFPPQPSDDSFLSLSATVSSDGQAATKDPTDQMIVSSCSATTTVASAVASTASIDLPHNKQQKGEAHAGKVVMRSWYERNKHIFPACRWEPFDPEKRHYNNNNHNNNGCRQ